VLRSLNRGLLRCFNRGHLRTSWWPWTSDSKHSDSRGEAYLRSCWDMSSFETSNFEHSNSSLNTALGYSTAPPAVGNTSSTTDPAAWSLLNPDSRQPPGHWFFSALMSYTWDGFSGYYAGSTQPVGHLCNVFVPSLWPTFQLHCLAPSRPNEGKKWQSGIGRERAQSRSDFRPHLPHIDQMPDEPFEAYCTGQ
jgi:hypothetical protein